MVVPIIAAGARVVAGGAARGGASRAATQTATKGRSAQALRQQAPRRNTQQAVQANTESEEHPNPMKLILSPKWPVRVGNGIAFFVIVVIALGFDVLQIPLQGFHAIPVVGTALALIGSFLLGIVGLILIIMTFALCQVKYFSGKHALKKVAALAGPIAIEASMLFAAVPALTSGAVTTFIISRLEDYETYLKQERAKKAAKQLDAEYAAREAARQSAEQTAYQREALAAQEDAVAQESDEQEMPLTGEAGPMPGTRMTQKRAQQNTGLTHNYTPPSFRAEPFTRKNRAPQPGRWN
jgi:hypothetical protein